MKPQLTSLTDYGDLIPIKEWLSDVECGGFIDYDGFVSWACEDGMLDDHDVYPSDVKKIDFVIPDWATHVMWYNR